MATFGYTSIGSSEFNIAYQDYNVVVYDDRLGDKATLSEAGTLDSVTGYMGGDTSCEVKGLLNDFESGGSGNHGEIFESSGSSQSSTYGWRTYTASSEALTAGDYIVNFIGNGSSMPSDNYYTFRLKCDTSGGYGVYSGSGSESFESPESPWTPDNEDFGYKFSIYATYTASATVSVNADVLSLSSGVQAPTLTAVKNVSVNAGVLSQTFSLPTASVSSSTDVVLTPSQLDIAASIPSPTISVVKNVSIAPTTLTNSFSVPSVGISIGDTTTPAVLSQTFTIPSPTVTAVYNVSVSADVVAATSSIPSPTVSVVRNISVSPNSLALAFSIPAETVVAEGGYLKNSPFYLSIGGGLSIMLGGQRIPVWNTQNRPTGKSGLVGYNREAGKLEIYDGAAWQTITVD